MPPLPPPLQGGSPLQGLPGEPCSQGHCTRDRIGGLGGESTEDMGCTQASEDGGGLVLGAFAWWLLWAGVELSGGCANLGLPPLPFPCPLFGSKQRMSLG